MKKLLIIIICLIFICFLFGCSVSGGSEGGRNYIGGGLLILLGLFDAIFPKTGWKIFKSWQYNDVEPTETALKLYRGGGIIVAIIGLIVMFK